MPQPKSLRPALPLTALPSSRSAAFHTERERERERSGMAAVAAATRALQQRIPGVCTSKLEHRKRSNPRDATAKGSGGFKSNKKVKKLRQRRKAVERDSDAEEEEEEERRSEAASSEGDGEGEDSDAHGEAEGKWENGQEEGSSGGGSEEEAGEKGMQKGVTKFTHGCRAFKMAFSKIMKKSAQADALLGPVLSAHKQLVVTKLAEEEEEQKAKGEAKKERHLAAEKGHVKPASFLDSKEKFLISVATKGVVKLFNAVNKAQNPQKGLDPARSKDAKELAKQRKGAFLSEMRRSTTWVNDKYSSFNPNKVPTSTGDNNDEPGWAPLRDSYMLTSSKLKDWNKMEC